MQRSDLELSFAVLATADVTRRISCSFVGTVPSIVLRWFPAFLRLFGIVRFVLGILLRGRVLRWFGSCF